MNERSLIFPVEEFQQRTSRLQEEMAKASVGALLLTSPADIFYVTGFLTRFWESPARPWFLVVPASGVPIAVIPAIGAPLMRRTWVQDIRTWDAPDPRDDGVTLLSDTIAELVPTSGSIAVPKGLETHLRMPLEDFERTSNALAPRKIVDGTAVVQRTREIKSIAEIDKIKNICAIAGQAFDMVPEMIRAGPSLSALFRQFQSGLLQNGADWVSYVAGAAGAGGYVDVISPATHDPIRTGDVVMLDTGAVRDGYFCDFDRNYLVGAVEEDVLATHHALWDATETALSELNPGMRACDAHRILADSLGARGVAPGGGRLGHGLGVTLTEWPSFTPLDRTELREGMVLTLEPSAYTNGDRFLVHEENIVLRAGGAELLSPRAPRDPVVV